MDKEFKFNTEAILYYGPSEIIANTSYDILVKKIGTMVVNQQDCKGMLLRVEKEKDDKTGDYTVTGYFDMEMDIVPEPYSFSLLNDNRPVPIEEEIHG